MVEYKCCTEVDKKLIFQTFTDGFSDYIVKVDIPEDFFFSRFFGPEGNTLKYSFIAIKDGVGIGLVLGGIREFDNLKTMRCGTMCVISEYRGTGIAQELIRLHKKKAVEENCKQLFLEVVVGNDRAIKFYEKNNYIKIYNISYYLTENLEWLENINTDDIEEIDFNELKAFRESFKGLHINWQNEMEFIKQVDLKHYGIKENERLIGAISMIQGTIKFIGVEKEYRNKGIAKSLIKAALSNEVGHVRFSFSNNSSLEGYCRKYNFIKENIEQYEMYSFC